MIAEYLERSSRAYARLAAGKEYPPLIQAMADMLWGSLSDGGKVLFAGNGGSAADCQHLAGELVVRFRRDRAALPGIALTVDSSVLTACLNDYGAEYVFSRQVEGLGRPGDVLWVFSTSGGSRNIVLACEAARRAGLKVLGFTGEGGGPVADVCDLCFRAPDDVTSHVQECHIAVGHLLCLMIEERVGAGGAG